MPLSLYWFILLNGAIYALVGLLIEVLRPVNRHRLSNWALFRAWLSTLYGRSSPRWSVAV